jgi:hypothetical protein
MKRRFKIRLIPGYLFGSLIFGCIAVLVINGDIFSKIQFNNELNEVFTFVASLFISIFLGIAAIEINKS